MAIDYVKLAATAKRLITESGRTITLLKPVDPDPVAREWNNPAQYEELIVPAVQVMPNQVRVFGLSALGDATRLDGLFTVSEKVYILFAGEAILDDFTALVDEGVEQAIEATQTLKPATVTLLGFVGTRR